jgi:hypothetical protein
MTPAMITACENAALNALSASSHRRTPMFMSGQAVPAATSIYVRFWVLPSPEVFQVGLGVDARSRNVGVLQADVYGPKDRGAGETGDIAFALAKAFTRLDIEAEAEGWVVCKDAGVQDLGDMDEEHKQMMRVPYRYDFVLGPD